MTASQLETGPRTGNAATVADIYAAFGRGDVPAIVARLADDVAWEEWADNWAQRAGVEYMQPRTGRQGALEFFTVIGAATVLDFAVLDVVGDGRQVVAEIRVAFELPGGGRFADEELHLWTFDEAGRVVRFRHYLDTAKHIAADRGEDTTRR
ncbi:nuclear transport factor 2 family protein [Geodermatophilus sp. YIM 151500]|uniref:nuclear transport factor 2 family protein n=1 Tax=Geodermatophilus sp. YIM 151500 TaxID=2984531 RepID=UPI0021E4D44D|nr:nuclear transport factor 2 family protein [Geodermatophilus sp. YIM 151500]MCV2491070.1 nuclear transport factor 2 family protein [Geodermatophilus sp. YIM 151500]